MKLLQNSLIAVFVVLSAGLLIFLIQGAPDSKFGSFSGYPKVELIDPPPDIRLLDDLEFTSKAGEVWLAPKSYVSNGASIPRFAWLHIGGPLSGAYRDASIIHDYYCQNYTTYWNEDYKRDWKSVHRAFYFAMRARGVNRAKAQAMYWAVYYLGPRWEWKDGKVRRLNLVRLKEHSPLPDAEKLMKEDIDRYFRSEPRSFEEIEGYFPDSAPFHVEEREPGPWQSPRTN